MSLNNISLINLNSQFNPFYSSINIDSSGNVGIGKTNPLEILDISGNIKFSENIIGSGYNLTSLNATNITSGVLSVNRGGTGATTLTAGSILVGNGTSTLIQPSNLTWNTGTNTLSATNFVGSGAGLTSLNATNITGNINVAQGGTGLTTLTTGQLLVGNGTGALTQSANLVWDNTNNRLGIGITNPQYILDIQGVQPTLRLLDTRSDGNAIISLNEFTDNYGYDIAYIGNTDNKLYIRGYNNSATPRIDMTFDRTTGNVGIGTTTPNTKLDVNGNISLKSDSASSLFWSGTLTSLGRANGSGDFSSSAVAGDLVLRSVGKLILQSGTGIGAIVIDTSNNINIDSGILYIDASNNNVGIGTTQPNKKLHVTGDTRIEGSLIVNGTVTQINTNVGTTEQLLITNDGTGPALIVNQTGAQPIIEIQDDSATCFKIFDGGNLGIGTATKVVSVDISGNLKLSGSITGSGSGLSALNASNISSGTLTVSNGGTGLTTLTSGQILIGGANVIQTSNLTWDNINNRLGIGTTVPLLTLDISGNLLIRAYGTTDSGTRGIFFRSDHLAVHPYNCSILTFDHGGGGPTDGISINGYGGVSFCTGANTRHERMRIDSNGNIGIGKTPGYMLDVNGIINATELRVNGTVFTSSTSQWTTVGSNIHYNSGNVGIGTTVINEKLTISGTSGRHAMFINTTTSSSSYVGFSNSANDSLAYLGVDGIGLTNYVYGALTLGTWKDKPILFTTGSTNTEKMRIDSNGNVYIGSSTNSSDDNNASIAFPDSTFYVRGPRTAASTTNIVFRGGLEGNNNGKVRLWFASDASHASYIENQHTTSGNTILMFGTSSGNALPTERMRIGSDGTITTNNNNINAGTGTITAATFSGNATTASGLTGTPNITVGTVSCSSITGSGQTNQITNNTDGGVRFSIRNNSSGISAFTGFEVQNSLGNSYTMFLNSSTRTVDGGVNTATLRNDAGDLRLSALSNSPFIYLKSSNGNVGFGTTNPSALLHIEKFISPATTLDLLNMSLDANWGLKVQQSYTAVGNIQYNLIHKYNGVDYNSLTFKGANVGIGTTNPTTAKLVITGTAGATGLDMSTTDQYAEMRVIRNSLSSIDKHLYLNLGSGTTTAEIKLYSNSTEIFKVGNTGVSFAHSYWHSSLDGLARLYFSNADRTYIRGHGSTPIEFRNASDTTIATISSTGNLNIVGNEIYIGPDSGSSRIFLGGGAAGDTGHSLSVIESRNYASTEKTELLLFKGNDGDTSSGPDRIRLRAAAIAFDTYTPSSNDRTAESIRMYINSDGNIGIGTSANISSRLTINNIVSDRDVYDHSDSPLTITHPTATTTTVLNDPKTILHLCRQGTGGQTYGAKASFKLCRWENNTTNSRTRLDITLAHGMYDDVNIMSIISDGSVGIGTNVPAVKLHVTGDIVATGNITAYFSDERLKTKIANIINPLKIINNLNGFYYTPNELARKNGIIHTDKEIGLSAQDVQKVLPELVKLAPFDLVRDKDGNKISKSGENYLTLSYERLAPVFVEAIKELQKENNNLKQKYDNLLQDMLLIKQTLNLI